MMELLDFKMPPFKTIAWVDDSAKAVWSPRFTKINEAILESCVQAVLDGKVNSQLLVLEGYLYYTLIALCTPHGIETEFTFLGGENAIGPIFYEVLMYKKEEDRNGNCCSERSDAVRLQEKKEFVWEAALQTKNPTIEEHTMSLSAKVDTSIFWQRMLVTVGPQHRCSLRCKRQEQSQKGLLDELKTCGFEEEATWLSDIHSWPIEWSASHGICELRTPVVKLAYDTDATAVDHIIQIAGESYPEEGAPGKRFPYRQKSFLKISDSKSFQLGLQHGA